jgi:multidrug efflux system membrane fusion protein
MIKKIKYPSHPIYPLIIFFIVGAFIVLLTLAKSQTPSQPPQQLLQKIMHVEVKHSTAQLKKVYHTVQGHTDFEQKITLRAETNGQVSSILATKGRILKEGEEILCLSLKSRTSKLNEAEALAAQKKIEYEAAQKLAAKGFHSKTKLAEAKAQHKAAITTLQQAKEEIGHTKILAPFNGLLDERYVHIGDLVQVGDKLATFIKASPILVIAYVSEYRRPQIRLGDSVPICLSDNQKVMGIISFIGSIADPKIRSFRVEITITNPSLEIMGGVTATAHIPIKEELMHHVSPAIISLDDQGIPGLKIVNKEGAVEFYPVEITSFDEQGVWVEGLPKFASIITVGQDFVNPGQKVKVIEAHKEGSPS